jgi:hypothetical protein
VKLARLRKPKIVCSPSYVDFRSKTKAVYIIRLGSHAKGRTHTGGIGKGRKRKTWVWCAHYRGANTITLKWQRLQWEGDWEVVKKSGSNESVRVVKHLCLEAMLGISLYSYPYLNQQKCCLSYYCLCLLFNKIGEKVRTGSAWKWGWWGHRQQVGDRGKKWSKQCTHIWINEKEKRRRPWDLGLKRKMFGEESGREEHMG